MTDLRRALDAWRGFDVTVRDLPLVLVFALAPLVPSLQHQGTQLGGLPDRPLDALAVAVVALQCLPLAVRRRWPALCLALVSTGFAVDQLRGYHTVAGAALIVALLSTAAHLERGRRTTVVVACVAYAGLAVALERGGGSEGAAGYVTFFLVLALAWGAGAWLRQTRAAEAEQRRHLADATRTAERTRIARELHDVVTHHVTAMVVQAEAARYRISDPAALDGTLAAVADTGRRAVADLRDLLDVLDPGHGPGPRTPAVAAVRDLVEQTRQAGQPVTYVEEGDPTPAVAGTAYRVVQEALTNALKHAHGSPTTVHVHHGTAETTVRVVTEGPEPGSGSFVSGGRGIAGLRERVGLLGGQLRAGPDGGRFVVDARIPAERTS
ncbi:histidine kinase [Xylanimonas cellulosilytica DSM 15894]|uniref:histidine kinase n=1 Tax=Xylanimonas cellulosilytica (strain DSM 15894 / JCM 12276 / CECT 5975 / KCTC 9989 / LMG 20990 / NBRC 107835 / XIL07) TaxID=446471 RepID=D1BSF2_XYLCX|nr:histidine kinase [Xylanimonas cellulosilytica]ACZ30644.1 histidine kinase [Xylanimonas cellulosilytica DSM 15894]